MSGLTDSNELRLLLARAFDRAWNRYYRPSRISTISEEVARHSLAKQLVALAREGVAEEDALAQGGLEHLISLTPSPWGEVRIERAAAKFQQIWRVQINRLWSSR
jgi:hypothetical protein